MLSKASDAVATTTCGAYVGLATQSEGAGEFGAKNYRRFSDAKSLYAGSFLEHARSFSLACCSGLPMLQASSRPWPLALRFRMGLGVQKRCLVFHLECEMLNPRGVFSSRLIGG